MRADRVNLRPLFACDAKELENPMKIQIEHTPKLVDVIGEHRGRGSSSSTSGWQTTCRTISI
jgi:hypothetical protein